MSFHTMKLLIHALYISNQVRIYTRLFLNTDEKAYEKLGWLEI